MRVKTSITLPKELLGRLDQVDKNRSALLERAARAYLAQLERQARDRKDTEIIDPRGTLKSRSLGHAGIPETAVKRGEFYLLRKPGSQDPRKQRVFVIVSRQVLVDSRFSTLICAPVYSRYDGLSTQVRVGTAEGLKKKPSIHCDEFVSLPKSALTHYVGSLKTAQLRQLNSALAVSLGLEDSGSLGTVN